MTRDDFKNYVAETIESVFQEAERISGCSIPRRFCFGYVHPNRILAEQEQVAEYITQLLFIDEEHIYPCFDLLFGDILDDGRILFVGYRAHFPPREFYRGFSGPVIKQATITIGNKFKSPSAE